MEAWQRPFLQLVVDLVNANKLQAAEESLKQHWLLAVGKSGVRAALRSAILNKRTREKNQRKRDENAWLEEDEDEDENIIQ